MRHGVSHSVGTPHHTTQIHSSDHSHVSVHYILGYVEKTICEGWWLPEETGKVTHTASDRQKTQAVGRGEKWNAKIATGRGAHAHQIVGKVTAITKLVHNLVPTLISECKSRGGGYGLTWRSMPCMPCMPCMYWMCAAACACACACASAMPP